MSLSTFLEGVQRDATRYWPALVTFGVVWGVRRLFAVPSELAHLPRVPILPTLWSFLSGESDDARIKRLILPYANKHGESLVLVFAFDRWIVHVLDYKIARDIFEDIERYPKEVPPDGLFIWKLVGYTNIILANGDVWKRHSKVVKTALNRTVPLDDFTGLARQLFKVMKSSTTGLLRWDDHAMRYTLDAVGTTAMGHNFEAIEDPHSSFVSQYHSVMESISNPIFLFFPRLAKIFPQKKSMQGIEDMKGRFTDLLEEKKLNKGNDMLTYMLEEPGVTDEEYRDNVIVFFIAGHDTTAGSISSLTYYLAMNPKLQQRAREEVLEAMKDNKTGEPTMDDFRRMPFLQACIRETLRMNTPITYLVPRTLLAGQTFTGRGTKAGVPGKSYYVPKGASIIHDLTGIHYNELYWPEPNTFKPERFMNTGVDKTNATSDSDAQAWLPFATGARQCPARNFALYEIRTLVAMLLREWEWELPADSPHRKGIINGFSPFALSLPKNLYIQFRRRKVD